MTKKFKKSDGYLEEDFLHFGYDHIDTGIDLLKSDQHWQYDSAGTLIHLGFEQVLEAWYFHYFKKFSNIHNLIRLSNSIPEIKLTKQFQNTLEMLDKFFLLRYSRRVEGPIEIGNDDFVGIEQFNDYLWEITSKDLKINYENLNYFRKGGRY